MTTPRSLVGRRRRFFVATLFFALTAVSVPGLSACSSRVPTFEERAVALDRQLMCPICDGQTLDESQSQLAQQMKQVIREKLAQGETEEQVKAYFSSPDRYGPAVLASPPASGFNLVLWALPPAVTVAGLGGLFLLVRAMRGRPGQAQTPATDPALGTYLEQVDREVGLAGNSTRQPTTPGGDGPHVERRNG